MFRLLKPIPKDITIAFSGGVDSVAVADFLNNNHNLTLAFFNHGTTNSRKALQFVSYFAVKRGLPLVVGEIQRPKKDEESLEEYWRNERYNFISTLGPVVTCHHLDDCVETYLWACLHGLPKVIPITRDNVIRPFLTTPKSMFWEWCQRHELGWYEDTSNADIKFTRNYIRHQLMPHALQVNPGLYTVVKKLVEKQL